MTCRFSGSYVARFKRLLLRNNGLGGRRARSTNGSAFSPSTILPPSGKNPIHSVKPSSNSTTSSRRRSASTSFQNPVMANSESGSSSVAMASNTAEGGLGVLDHGSSVCVRDVEEIGQQFPVLLRAKAAPTATPSCSHSWAPGTTISHVLRNTSQRGNSRHVSVWASSPGMSSAHYLVGEGAMSSHPHHVRGGSAELATRAGSTGSEHDDEAIKKTPEAVIVEDKGQTSSSKDDDHNKKLLVIGGNGFVGTHICREAVSRGVSVMGLSRSGPPGGGRGKEKENDWVKEVDWIRGNVFDTDSWRSRLKEVSAVISCVGGFGTNEAMRKINGDANVVAVNAASEEGVKRFVYISAHYMSVPAFLIRGYYDGKKAAEKSVQSRFPYGGVILRPGFIHGNRDVGNLTIPLSLIGAPLETAMRSRALGWASNVPLIGSLFVPPVKATAVARVAVRAATDNAIPPGVLDVWSILKLAEK